MVPGGPFPGHCGRERAVIRLFHKAKHRLQGWCEAQFRAIAAENIAAEIELSVAGPGVCCEDPYCPDAIRVRQARADADLARRVGGAER